MATHLSWRKLQDKCSVDLHWIVKDGQRVQVGAWVHGHHDKLLKFLHQFLTVMSNTAINDIHYKDYKSHRMTTLFVDTLREIHVERNCQWWTKLGVNWPVMFDERALVWSQAREQGRRLHDKENDIDEKLTQMSSCTEKLFLIHYHNQLAPSCTSVRCRQEYWRWKCLLYCNPKNVNLK